MSQWYETKVYGPFKDLVETDEAELLAFNGTVSELFSSSLYAE